MVLASVGYVVGAVAIESMIALALQSLSSESSLFWIAETMIKLCSGLLGVLFATVCVDASIGKLGIGTVIGIIYGLVAPLFGDHLALMIIQVAMRIMPALVIIAGILLMLSWFARGEGRVLGGVGVLLVVGLLAAAMFGHVAHPEAGGAPGAMAYAEVFVIYTGGFLLGTTLAIVG